MKSGQPHKKQAEDPQDSIKMQQLSGQNFLNFSQAQLAPCFAEDLTAQKSSPVNFIGAVMAQQKLNHLDLETK